jgi:hypothetical protein
VGIGAQKLDTIESHPARLREDAQQPDMIAVPTGAPAGGAVPSSALRLTSMGTGPNSGEARRRALMILDGEAFDRGVGVRELPIEGAHEGKQRRDDREQAPGRGRP